jgi:hypothetical protein
MEEDLQELTVQYVENNFYKYICDTKKIEKIPSKFIRNTDYTSAQIAVDCEDIEFIDHEINITLNEDKKYGSKNIVKTKQKFQILKLKNLLIRSFDRGQYANENCVEENDYPTRVVSGKKFVVLAFTPIFHGFTEFYSQFEILNDFDNEIKPFFIFDHHDQPYHKDIYDIYKNEFNLNNEDIFSNGKENVIIEEVYIIHDDNAFISDDIDKKFNLVKLVSGDKISEISRYYRASRSLIQDYVDVDKEFPFKLPVYEACLFGLSLMAKRHRKYINKFDKKIDVLYISRENYSNKFNEDFEKTLEEETVNPKNFFNTCKTYFNRTILDETKFIDLLKIYFNKKEKQIKKVFFEELSYINQISLIQNSDVVISLQGSGLCNAIFADKKTKIIEIAHPFDDQKFRELFNPVSVDTPEKHLNYIKSANWYTIMQADWKDLSVEVMNNKQII